VAAAAAANKHSPPSDAADGFKDTTGHGAGAVGSQAATGSSPAGIREKVEAAEQDYKNAEEAVARWVGGVKCRSLADCISFFGVEQCGVFSTGYSRIALFGVKVSGFD
jgi:hypothetical protein